MELKKTKIWKTLKKVKNERAKKKHYRSALKMPESNYEEYLIKRYSEIMNRRNYTKGKTLSFDDPKTFTEKSQWLKLYDQDPRKTLLSDKYAVRGFIKESIGDNYLIPLISIDGREVFYDANDIDFEKLPNQFVIKCNHGSHMNIVVKDKSLLTKRKIHAIKKQLNSWLKIDYVFYVSLETQYLNIKPCILIEKFVDMGEHPRDYKFLCFNGKMKYFWVSEDCLNKEKAAITTYDSSLKVANFNMNIGYNGGNVSDYSLPNNICEMISIAETLSSNFIFVRVDLYNINGKILFGEMTFNSAAGYDAPNPIEYDEILGELLKIDYDKRKDNFRYRKK